MDKDTPLFKFSELRNISDESLIRTTFHVPFMDKDSPLFKFSELRNISDESQIK